MVWITSLIDKYESIFLAQLVAKLLSCQLAILERSPFVLVFIFNQCSVFLWIQGNGFCDCGDPEAFLQHHLCKIHEEASKNEVSAKEVLESFPNDLRVRTKELFRIILQYIISMTATRKSKFDEWKVGPKEKETWPALEYPFTHSTHCCLLINDDSHSYAWVPI